MMALENPAKLLRPIRRAAEPTQIRQKPKPIPRNDTMMHNKQSGGRPGEPRAAAECAKGTFQMTGD